MKERMYSVDAIKGFAMLLVIVGHMNYAIIGNTTFTVIYSFHMPLFFLITGYLFKVKENVGFIDFTKKKARGLLKPYLYFLFISYIYGYHIRPMVSGEEFPKLDIKEAIEAVFLSGGHLTEVMLYNFPLWFLPLLFIAELIFFWVAKIKNKKIVILMGVIVFFLIGLIQTKITGRPPYHINVLPAAILFMMIGFLFKEQLSKIRMNKITVLVLALIALYLGSYNMGTHIAKLGNSFIYVTVAMIWISIIFSVFNEIKTPNFLTYIGENTLQILGYHAIIINLYYLIGLGDNFNNYNGIVKFSIDYLLVILCIVVIIEIKGKIKCKRSKMK